MKLFVTFLTLIFGLTLVIGVSVFSGQNTMPVILRFGALRSVLLPLGLVMTLTAELGALTILGMVNLFWPRRSVSVIAQRLKIRMDSLPDQSTSNK
jgi:uncharacterized integral membrane protein